MTAEQMRQAMQARSWRVTINGTTVYKPTEAAAEEVRQRALRVFAREGEAVPAITIEPPPT